MSARTSKESVLFSALLVGTLLAPALSSSGHLSAQDVSFRARLSPLPVDGRLVRTITGVGQVRATLAGDRLTITGTFEGLASPATAAHVHIAPAGERGPAVGPLEVSTSPEGDITGSVVLSIEDSAALLAQSLYIQIHSEENPDGELRGWIYDVADLGAEPGNMESESLTVADLMRDFVPITDEMLRNPDPADWPMMRGNYHAQSYSRLDQINAGNVGGLQLEWVWNMHDGNSEPAPLVYGGVIYLINPGNVIQALDGRTGDLIWEHATGPDNSQDMRGIAIYQDMIIQGTTDARIVALDARTGELVWETDIQEGNSNSSGPLVADGKVISGLAGCARYTESRCFISAHDANTGELVWRFNTIAEAGEPGGDTWGDLDNIFRKGGETWITGSYDPVLNLTYWGVAQAKPWMPVSRGNSALDDGLYTSTTLALNPDDGSLNWYYQHAPGESLDLDEVFERVIVDIDGERTLYTIGKPGILWQLDRTTGEFISATDLGYQNLVDVDPASGAVTYRPGMIPEIGVEMTIENLPPAVMWGEFWGQSQFDSAMVGITYLIGADPDVTNRFHSNAIAAESGSGSNNAQYSNPEVDRLLEDGAHTFDVEKRKEIYREIQAIIRVLMAVNEINELSHSQR